jgi:hypothetical protein
MVANAITFTGQVGYVTRTGQVVRRLAGNHEQPWVIGESRFSDSEVTDMTHTQELFVGEKVFYRPRRQFGTVKRATWIGMVGWSYHLQLLGGACEYVGIHHLERLTVRTGDFIEGHCVTSGTRHRGRVTAVLPQPASINVGTFYRLDKTGLHWLSIPIEPTVIFDEFVYPLGGGSDA